MTFQPVVPAAGLAGWRFLQRTYDKQLAAFSESPQLKRDGDYFAEKISEVRSASELVSDRRLLGVALEAFGLLDDLNNRAFIQKVLEDGSVSRDALANRLTDGRYRRLSEAFGFGPAETIKTSDSVKMSVLRDRQITTAFETSVGEQDDTMRIALYAQRELESLAAKGVRDDVKWFSVMGLPPLRSMFEIALGLPASFGQIDIDRQLQEFRDRTGTVTGESSISQFANPERRERLTDLFLARSQINDLNASYSSGAIALQLLQSV